jgi:mono/diheme cytochrome c family protein
MQRRSPVIAVLLATAIGCGKSGGNSAPEPAPTAQVSATPSGGGGDPAAKAKEVFSQRCVPCHGASGAGDGAASASLTPKPRAFGDAEWQASVTDDHIMKIVQYGGAAVGKNASMPGNPDLSDRAVLSELAKVVRGFKQ